MKTLAEVTQELEHTRTLIQQGQRNLRKLKEQAALYGPLNMPLHISNEIEKTEEDLAQLNLQLETLSAEQEVLAAPAIWVANLAGVPGDLPGETIVVDHSQEFVFAPRQVPAAERWQGVLWPELSGLYGRLSQARVLRLQGSSSLTTAFAFGQLFRNVGGRRLAVEQNTPAGSEVWVSNEKPPTAAAVPEFKRYLSAVNLASTAQAGLVIIFALPQTTLATMVSEVGAYWNEPPAFKQIVTDPAAPYTPQQAKGVLVLEAETASQGGHLAGWQAAALAQTSRRKLINFIDQVEPERLHLFFAGPLGLAAFIGHHWNQVGLNIQCYERLNRNLYTPCLTL